jgi:uncharacterized protein (TIGR00369 family)
MEQRTRTHSWADPVALATEALARSGLDFMQAMARGELPPPPVSSLIGMDGLQAEEGEVVFACTPAEWMYNPIGSVHGGIALTLLDSAMGCAVHTTCPAGTGYTSLELKLNFVRPMSAGTGRVLATGTVVHRGRRMATAEGRLTAQDGGKLLAHATTTCLILAP